MKPKSQKNCAIVTSEVINSVYRFNIYVTVRGSDSLRSGTVYRIWSGCFPASRSFGLSGVRLFGVRGSSESVESLRTILFCVVSGFPLRTWITHSPNRSWRRSDSQSSSPVQAAILRFCSEVSPPSDPRAQGFRHPFIKNLLEQTADKIADRDTPRLKLRLELRQLRSAMHPGHGVVLSCSRDG